MPRIERGLIAALCVLIEAPVNIKDLHYIGGLLRLDTSLAIENYAKRILKDNALGNINHE